MLNPVTALLLSAVVALLLAVLFWPEYGLASRWQRIRQTSRRVLIEDALKHLYDCEYRRIVCTRQSLAGALAVAADETARVLERLVAMSLVLSQEEGYVLTDEGRSYALRVIRMHRLWERYLADETGVEEMEWHQDAERREHLLTNDEADALSARMGNPRYDPHGDPIPTPAGDLPGKRGIPLSQLQPGNVAEIVHVEDEPATVYAQLVAQNLHPGLRLRVLESTREKVRFEAEGVENLLAPIVAMNVTVVPLVEEPQIEGPHETLAGLREGESARVVGLSLRCRGQQRRRLLDLGLIPGTLVRTEMISASGDPTAYTVRGATIALRRAQATLIHIRKEERN
jgi:DtxR family transcriptional regulator, Mn-dependent transcriptional regulator